MGTFNFSNMQQKEDKMLNVPEEFRGAVEKAASEPVGSYGENNKTGFWDGVKNFFSSGDVDTSAGFLDETGTWNNGQDLQKYNPTQKQFNNSVAGQMFNSNAYKKYFYSREDVLQEAKTISAATHIPENAILANADNLKNARDVYNYQQRAMDPQAVFKAYPELGELAKKSDTDAAIALHNLKNVRQTQGIIEAAKTGWELDSLMSERGRIGYAAMNGKELTEENLKRLEEIKKQQEQAKELPGLFEDPLGAVVGGTVQSGKMMLRNLLSGQKLGVYGAAAGAVVGGLAAGTATGGAGLMAGAAAGSRFGYSIGSRIGMAQDMYDEIAGNNYLDYKNYKDKNGKQLLTDNQARAYAAAAAAVETGIEFANADKIIGIVKGGAGAQSLKNIIANAKDSTELQSLLAAYVRNGVKNVGEVTLTESAEEGVQEMSNRIITNIAASNNPGGDIPAYTAEEVLRGGIEASWQALPTSFGFGVSAHAASTVGYARRMAAAMEIKNEKDRADIRTANGISMLRNLAEDLKSNELFKKSPEIYREVLDNQLKGTDLESVNIDVELVLNQEGGYELLKTVADKAGMSEEQFNNVVETKADIKIDTATYVEKLLPSDIGAKLEDYITFDDIGESLARNRMYASRMRREMDKVLAFAERQREDALNNFLDQNFPDASQREVAEAVIRRFPDNPKEGVKVIRQSLQDKIDAPLKEIIEQLKAGAGKGVSIHAVDEDGNLTGWENSDHGKGVRVSNNAPWYQKWYKEYGRKPSEKEYRELAYDIYTGHNPYGLEGWENSSAEENQWYEDNEAAMEATQGAIERLDALTPRLEKIDPGELTITEGLSEEAFEVYQEMRKKLFEGAGGEKLKKKAREQARQTAQMNAILFARMADRMAEWHRKAGQTKYTAKNFARSVGVEFGGKAGVGLAQQETVHIGTEYTHQRPTEEVLEAYRKLESGVPIHLDNTIIQGDDIKQIRKNAIRACTSMYMKDKKAIPVYTKNGEALSIVKGTAKEILRHSANKDIICLLPNLGALIGNAEFLYDSDPNPERLKRMIDYVTMYKTYGTKAEINGREYYVKLLARVQTNGDIVLHDADISEVKKIKAEPKDPSDATYNAALMSKGSTFAVNSIPWWLNEVKTKLISVNKIQDNNNVYDQKAYHGSGAVFDNFDLGYLGDGTGNIIHGWGLYFAKSKRVAENYKKAVSEQDDSPSDLKAAQFDVIKQNNAMTDDYHTGIRSVDDILTGKEALGMTQKQLNEAGKEGYSYPDFTFADGEKALKTGKITIYSSKEIKPGTFVSPSKMMAKDYAGGGEVYSKVVPLKDIAFINADEGQYAPAKREKQASLYEVEVPDNKYLLDEQAPFYKQMKSRQKLMAEAIKKLDANQSTLFWEKLLDFKLTCYDKSDKVRSKIKSLNTLAESSIGRIADTDVPKFLKNMSRRNLISYGYTAEQIDRMAEDESYRQQEIEKIKAEAASLESELEKAEAEDKNAKDKIIRQAQADPLAELNATANGQRFTGEKLYQALAYALGDKEYNWRSASEYLNQHGVKGIAYDGGEDGRCFVVFDDKAVDIIERYNQSAGERAMTVHVEGLEYKASNLEAEKSKYRTAQPVVVTKDAIQKTESISAISVALKKFAEIYPEGATVKTVLGNVVINKKSIKNSLAHGFSQKKLDAAVSLVDGMKQASYLGSIRDLDNQNIDNHFFAYKIEYDGQENIVFCRVKENAGQPMKLYIHEVVDMDELKKRSSSLNETASLENGSVSRQASEKMSTPRGLALYTSILSQFINDVNKSFNQFNGSDAGQKGLYNIKGQTVFRATGEKVISLFEAADQSTFMHEMAHVYLHDMLALAKLPTAPQQLLDDIKTLNDWASWRPETFDKEYKGTAVEREFWKLHEQIADAQKFGYLKIDGKDVTIEQLKMQWAQERFARGFESYLREGKAPAEAVRTVFQRFKQWLSEIYRAFVQIGGTPSKEVRAVMDRMIASEDEIDIAMSKKGVDDFTRNGGLDYLADNAKQVYDRMVERAKAAAKERVLKIALKDVKTDYREQEREFFEQEEKEYREKLAAEPVFIVQEHIKNNPNLSRSVVCQTVGGMSVKDYVAKLKEYGGSIDAAVKAHMKEFKKNIDNSGFDAEYFREKAEEIVQESKYRKLAAAMELNAFEEIARAQKRINVQAVRSTSLTNDEKGVMGTVNKLNTQSQKIDQLKSEKKEEAAKHRTEKKELREKLESEKKEGIAKERQAKEQIIANVRGLRDAALRHYKEYVEYVEKKLEVMPIEEANNYQMWRKKSAQAQYNSEHAVATGKWELAVKYKRAQVIYDMFADRAVRNDKKIKKIEEQLTKKRQTIIKNKNISANERYAYNHMLYVFGFVDADAPVPPKYQEENGFMGVLQKSDAPREIDGLFLECPFFTPEGFLNLPEWLVSAAMGTEKREQGHKDLSNEQMKLLAQVMNIIYKRGVDDMKLRSIESVDGKSLTVDEVIAEIEGQVRQRIVEGTIKDATGATKKKWEEEAARAINDANQYLIKPEVILKKLGSLSLKYIYEPLKLAADKELRMAHDMQKKIDGLFKRYTSEELYEMRNQQKYKFGTSVLTKEQVIMIALNWGTEINAKRVMDGYHVGEYDVRKVLAELTERDWNLVNDIWSLYDEHWEEVREIEARITGAVLEKQPNRAFTIIGSDEKSYTLEGGYFPIKYDPQDQRTQEQKADAAAMQQTAMSNISMSLGKGFLKERSNAKIERRLDLRFDVIGRSVADVIHLVAFREPVRDVRRIVLKDDFRNIVNRFLGEAEYKQLKKWTADCWAEEPVAQSKFEMISAKLRNAQTMGTMGFRVATAALNIANAPIVAHYMGTIDMLRALKKFYSSPRQYADFIFQRSVFMAERAETMDANIRDAIKGPHFMDGVPVAGKAGEILRDNAFKLITWTDLALALPLWQHEYEKAYNKELEAGHTPQQAQMSGVAAGDAAVRWCFGSGRTVDKAAVQRQSGEFMKQLTMYYSYMSTVYNAMNYKQWEARMGYKKAIQWADANKSKELLKAVAKMGCWLFAWQLMPAIMTALFKAATGGDDDDLKTEKLLKSIGKETLSTLVGGIPVLRDAVPYLLAKAFDDKQFAPKIPIQNTIEQTNRVIQSITNDKKSFADVLRESGKLISQTTGTPSTLVDMLTTTVTYMETGFDADIAEYLRAVILDKQLKKNKK